MSGLFDAKMTEKMTQLERRVKVFHKGVMLEEVATQKYLGALIDASGSMEP